MEKYTKAQMEVIEFEAEDVITTSGGTSCGFDNWCPGYSYHPCQTELS